MTVSNAGAVGYLVPADGFSGTVRLVARRSWWLDCGDVVAVVHGPDGGATPTSIIVASSMLDRCRPAVGDSVSTRAGRVAVGATTIDIGGAPRWCPGPLAPSLPARPWADGRTDEGWRDAATALARLAPQPLTAANGRLGWPWQRLLGTLALGIGGGPGGRSREALHDAVRGVIGLGPGLTPSGDDALIGLQAVLRHAVLAQAALRHAAVLENLGDATRTHLHRTTFVSAHKLRLAAGGHLDEAVLAVIAALWPPPGAPAGNDRLARAVRTLLGAGATSGSDVLAGVHAGARLLSKGCEARAA